MGRSARNCRVLLLKCLQRPAAWTDVTPYVAPGHGCTAPWLLARLANWAPPSESASECKPACVSPSQFPPSAAQPARATTARPLAVPRSFGAAPPIFFCALRLRCCAAHWLTHRVASCRLGDHSLPLIISTNSKCSLVPACHTHR